MNKRGLINSMKLAFTKSGSEKSEAFYDHYTRKYGNHNRRDADVIVALGGDGFILEILHSLNETNSSIPVFGINCGTVGFLLNEVTDEDLYKRIGKATGQCVSRLSLTAVDKDSEVYTAHAFNDVYVNRITHQAAKLNIQVNGIERIPSFSGDGVIVSTEMGSTAYNRSAGGPIIPLGSNLTALTPICGFIPKHWKGALLQGSDIVDIKVQEHEKRPVSVVADSKEFKNIVEVSITRDINHCSELLFDSHASLNEKLLKEQFYG
mgnify:CR=1 FL=1